ncbi:hypothetical protein IG631_16546 [Alternaria alternata]|nr:hypothetical protein IG631_16546 [Alternaria alternata]
MPDARPIPACAKESFPQQPHTISRKTQDDNAPTMTIPSIKRTRPSRENGYSISETVADLVLADSFACLPSLFVELGPPFTPPWQLRHRRRTTMRLDPTPPYFYIITAATHRTLSHAGL